MDVYPKKKKKEEEKKAFKTAFVECRHLLLGSKFPTQVYSDHRNLLFASKPQLLTQSQDRCQEFLSAFEFTIFYRPVISNGKADQLSRRVDHEVLVSQNLDESPIRI